MKICFLSRYQNKNERGVEIFVRELVIRLSKNNEIEVFAGKDSDDLFKIIKGRFDIVVPFNGRGQSFKVSLGRLFGSYKLVIGGHSGIGKDDVWNIVVCKPDVFVALTDFMKVWARKWSWGSKVVKISNGVDLNKFSPKGEKMDLGLPKPVILSVGTLSWYKHHEKVIEAVAMSGKGSVLIAGKGEMEDSLRDLGKLLLGKNFKVTSFDYDDLPKVYRSADLFTLPSWDREAFGLVYLEAMASGLPVVAPDDLSRKEIVGEAGNFVDVSDTKKYAEVISKTLESGVKMDPRKQAEKFSWDKISQAYQDLFESLIK